MLAVAGSSHLPTRRSRRALGSAGRDEALDGGRCSPGRQRDWLHPGVHGWGHDAMAAWQELALRGVRTAGGRLRNGRLAGGSGGVVLVVRPSLFTTH